MASRFPENFPEAKIAEVNEEINPLYTKKSTKFGLAVLRGEFLFLGSLGLATIIINIQFTQPIRYYVQFVYNCLLKVKIVFFYFTDSLVWYMLRLLFPSVSVKGPGYSHPLQ